MIKEAIEYITQSTLEALTPEDVFDDGVKIWKLVPCEDGKLKVMDFDHPQPSVSHLFGALDSLISYLNGVHAETAEKSFGVVFVNDNEVTADIRYMENIGHYLRLPLNSAPEFKILKTMTGGCGQKDLWRWLVTDMHGRIDEKLLLAIGQMKTKAKRTAESHIGQSGITFSSEANTFEVLFTGDKEQGQTSITIPVEWTYKGRIWECFPNEYEIILRLELITDGAGLIFKFHPRNLGDVTRQARLDLVKELSSKMPPHITVYEGSY